MLSFAAAMVQPLRRYANFTGRSGRREFWAYSLFLFLSYLVIWVVAVSVIATDREYAGPAAGVATLGSGVFFMANFVPGLALSTRRLHDLGWSGWLLVAAMGAMLILNFIAWIGYLVVMSLPSQKGRNAYGDPPDEPVSLKDVFS